MVFPLNLWSSSLPTEKSGTGHWTSLTVLHSLGSLVNDLKFSPWISTILAQFFPLAGVNLLILGVGLIIAPNVTGWGKKMMDQTKIQTQAHLQSDGLPTELYLVLTNWSDHHKIMHGWYSYNVFMCTVPIVLESEELKRIFRNCAIGLTQKDLI